MALCETAEFNGRKNSLDPCLGECFFAAKLFRQNRNYFE